MKVLFICTANSCRSQMAEAWAHLLFPDGWQVASAGLLTYPITQPTRLVMAEVGSDMKGQESKTIDRFDLDDFDLVVTLSKEAGSFLPSLAAPQKHWHRPLVDPMAASGTPEEVLGAFRAARDHLRGLVQEISTGGFGGS